MSRYAIMLAAGLAIAVALFGAGWWVKGRDVAADEAERRAQTIETREGIEDEVRDVEDDDLADRLSDGR